MRRTTSPNILRNRHVRRILVTSSVLAFLAAVPASTRAGVIVSWTGPSSFDDSTISFTGFQTSELTDVTGGGYYHDHGGPTTVFLDILLDGVWTNLFSDFIHTNNSSHFMDSIPTSFSFAQGTVSGLRLRSDPYRLNTFHALTPDTKFEFNTATASVPEPESLAVFGLGTLGLVVGGIRHRRKSQSV
ncbi:MAG: PEP-CTERM sorting domain-containing protein [Fuerstiella sp.]